MDMCWVISGRGFLKLTLCGREIKQFFREQCVINTSKRIKRVI